MAAAMHRPILIGHRGASGSLPEHTLPAYALAILQGADYIEPDLVATRDGVLVARHENEIGGTTDVAGHPEFAARRRVQCVDGIEVDGWFTEDFTLAELQTLRARERIAQLRAANAAFDGCFGIPTFEQILHYLAQVNATRVLAGLAPVGVYPETKHPSHFASIGLALEQRMLMALEHGRSGAPVFLQSFEVGNLRALGTQCDFPLVQLMLAEGGPFDQGAAADGYRQMTTSEGLRAIATYAQVIGVDKRMVLAEQKDGSLVDTGLVAAAHAAGLAVHVWTLRAENAFLPRSMRHGADPAAQGDLAAEVRAFMAAGVDGVFADHPGLVAPVLVQSTAVTGMKSS